MDIRRVGSWKKEMSCWFGNKSEGSKNKVAPPFKQAFFDILYGEGISRHGEIIDLGVEKDYTKVWIMV